MHSVPKHTVVAWLTFCDTSGARCLSDVTASDAPEQKLDHAEADGDG